MKRPEKIDLIKRCVLSTGVFITWDTVILRLNRHLVVACVGPLKRINCYFKENLAYKFQSKMLVLIEDN